MAKGRTSDYAKIPISIVFATSNRSNSKIKIKTVKNRNGDYDFSHYWYQAAWVEHDINDLEIKCKDDAGLFSEKVQVLSARRKRLYEDYEKDEAWKLQDIIKEFSNNFHITKDEAGLEMEEFGGTLTELYDHISTNPKYKLKQNKTSRIHFTKDGRIMKKRGRPKKIAI